MNEVELLESLNPVPSERGNPGPPLVTRPDRPRRRLVGAVAAAVVLVVGLMAASVVLRTDDGGVQLEVAQPAQQVPTPRETPAGSTPPPPTPVPNDAVVFQPEVGDGEAYGRLVIPAIDVDLIVVEGVDDEALRRGPGHHPSTAGPGLRGNAVFWGHRTTYGAPFLRIDELSVGDLITVTTARGAFEYRTAGTAIVAADSVEHLQNFGDNRLTLVTDHPEFSDSQRIVVTAELVGDPLPIGDSPDIDSTIAITDGGDQGTYAPSQVAAFADGYVGLAYDHEDRRRTTVVTSSDGLAWQPLVGAPAIYANASAISQHDGEVHILAIDALVASSDQDTAVHQIFHYTSRDLELWQQWSEPLPDPAVGADHDVWITSMVSAKAGVLVQLREAPNFGFFQIAVLEAGYDPQSICEMTGTATEARFRPCGTAEIVEVAAAIGNQTPGRLVDRLIFGSAMGDPFAEVSLPLAPDADTHPGALTLYPIDGGFGVAGPETLESSDGVTWVPVDTQDDVGPHVAARGSERVLRSRWADSYFGPNDPTLGMAFSADGSSWEPIDLAPLLEDEARLPVFYPSLTAGPGGWALVVQTKLQVEDFDQLDRAQTAGPSDFTLTNDGFVLEGHTPFGPAELRTSDGDVVREWNHLEVGDPEWSGLAVQSDRIAILDEAGDTITSFEGEAWATLFEPRSTFVFDVLYSADGTTWQRHSVSSLQQPIVIVGENELLIGQRQGWPIGRSPTEFTTVDLDG